MKPKYKTMYMHTINGAPGVFNGRFICFDRNGEKMEALLRPDLKSIRHEQRLAHVWDNEKGHSGFKYSYLRVRVPV